MPGTTTTTVAAALAASHPPAVRVGGRRVSISNQPRPKHAQAATTTDTSQENEEGGNEDEKNDYPRPVDAARAASAHRRIEPAHEYQEEERKRHQTSHANAGEHPSTQAEDVRKKDRADTRINQPAGKGVGA